MLTFDAPTHTYRWNGKVVPSVTQILSDLMDWSHVPADTLAKAQLRGSDVHLMCQWFDEDRLDVEAFTPDVQAYLPAYQRFLRECKPNWRRIEEPGYCQALGFAGTPDREGVLEGLAEWKDDEAVVDLKSGDEHPLQALQTIGYDKLRNYDGPPRKRATLHLRPNGTYKLREWDDQNDWIHFRSLLNTRNWIRKHL